MPRTRPQHARHLAAQLRRTEEAKATLQARVDAQTDETARLQRDMHATRADRDAILQGVHALRADLDQVRRDAIEIGREVGDVKRRSGGSSAPAFHEYVRASSPGGSFVGAGTVTRPKRVADRTLSGAMPSARRRTCERWYSGTLASPKVSWP